MDHRKAFLREVLRLRIARHITGEQSTSLANSSSRPSREDEGRIDIVREGINAKVGEFLSEDDLHLLVAASSEHGSATSDRAIFLLEVIKAKLAAIISEHHFQQLVSREQQEQEDVLGALLRETFMARVGKLLSSAGLQRLVAFAATCQTHDDIALVREALRLYSNGDISYAEFEDCTSDFLRPANTQHLLGVSVLADSDATRTGNEQAPTTQHTEATADTRTASDDRHEQQTHSMRKLKAFGRPSTQRGSFIDFERDPRPQAQQIPRNKQDFAIKHPSAEQVCPDESISEAVRNDEQRDSQTAVAGTHWSSLPLESCLVSAIKACGYSAPTEPQYQALGLYFAHQESMVVLNGTDARATDLAVRLVVLDTALKEKLQRRHNLGSVPPRIERDSISKGPDSPSACIDFTYARRTSSVLRPCAMILVPSSQEGTRIEAGLEEILRRGRSELSVASLYSPTDKGNHHSNSNAFTVDILICTLYCAAESIKSNSLSLENVKLTMWDDIQRVFAPAISPIGGGYRAQLDVIQKNFASGVRHVVLVPALTHDIASMIKQEVLRPAKMPPVLEIGVGTSKTAGEGNHIADHCLPLSQKPRRRRGNKRPLPGANNDTVAKKSRISREYVGAVHPVAGTVDVIDETAGPAAGSKEPPTMKYAVKVDIKANKAICYTGDPSQSYLVRMMKARRPDFAVSFDLEDTRSCSGNLGELVLPENHVEHEVETHSPRVDSSDGTLLEDNAASSMANEKAQQINIAQCSPEDLVQVANPPDESSQVQQQDGANHHVNVSVHQHIPKPKLENFNPEDICPSQTLSPWCKSACTLVGICWEQICNSASCEKVHGRPCPDFLTGVCTDFLCEYIGEGGHDPGWKDIHAGRARHNWSMNGW